MTARIGDVEVDSVFIVVPELVKDCIVGVGLLEEHVCVIDLHNKQLTIPGKGDQKEATAEIFHVEIVSGGDIEAVIKQKVRSIGGITEAEWNELQQILMDNKTIFRNRCV